MLRLFVLASALLSSAALAQTCPTPEPVIDVHLHTYEADPRLVAQVPNAANSNPPGVRTGPEHRAATIAALRQQGVIRALIESHGRTAGEAAVAESGGLLRLGFQVNRIPTPQDLAAIRHLHAEGRLTAIGEVGTPYMGVRYDDPRLAPLFALAEELDLPLLVHAAAGPPESYRINRSHRVRSSDILALEDVIVRHPRLRIVLQHMGWPHGDDTVAMMTVYPQIHVDTAAMAWLIPAPEFYAYLGRLVGAGFGRRILFGSDQMVWPEGIGLAIDRVRADPNLTADQKRDILYRNARRFFRWTDLPDC